MSLNASLDLSLWISQLCKVLQNPEYVVQNKGSIACGLHIAAVCKILIVSCGKQDEPLMCPSFQLLNSPAMPLPAGLFIIMVCFFIMALLTSLYHFYAANATPPPQFQQLLFYQFFHPYTWGGDYCSFVPSERFPWQRVGFSNLNSKFMTFRNIPSGNRSLYIRPKLSEAQISTSLLKVTGTCTPLQSGLLGRGRGSLTLEALLIWECPSLKRMSLKRMPFKTCIFPL